MFFRERARLFSEGEVAASADGIDLPLTASIVGSTFHANRKEDIVMALQLYRNNLGVESYARTEIVAFHGTEPVEGRAQAIVSYRNVNDQGAELDRFEASFICRQVPGGWRIVQADSVTDGTSLRFLSGLPLT